MRLRVAVVALFVVFAVVPLFPQAPSVPRAGESIEVSVVNVDAVVTDKQGNRIHGLHRDDFEIYENGVRQPISNFAEYGAQEAKVSVSAAAEPNAAPAAASAPRQPRTIVVFVERFHLPSFRTQRVFGAMKSLLHEAVRPGDRVMVLAWNRGVMMTVASYTDDPAKIDAAIDYVERRASSPSLSLTHELQQDIEDLERFGGGGPAEAVDPQSGLDFFTDQMARFSARTLLFDESRKVSTLKGVVRSLAGAEGKKILLLATHRMSMYAGAETMYVAGATQLPTDFRSEFNAQPMIRSLIETANANGVTIYPVYPEGLTSEAAFRTSDFRGPSRMSTGYDWLVLDNETPMLEALAHETGGMTAWGSDDVAKLLPRIADDLDDYYSLGYRATAASAGTRRVEVKVRDSRYVVRARHQFTPKNETTRMEDRVIAALFGNAPAAPFRVVVRTGAPSRVARQKVYVTPVAVDIPIAALTMLPTADGNSYAGSFTVYTSWGGPLGGVTETSHETHPYTIAKDQLERAKKSHFTYNFSITTSAPSVRVGIGVYDEVGKDYALDTIAIPPPAEQAKQAH